MISRHRDREGVSVRTGGEIRDAANAALDEHGWTMAQFLIASLKALIADPKQTLTFLASHRPPLKPRGRPPRSAEE